MSKRYATDHNTAHYTVKLFDDNKKLISETEFVVWISSSARFREANINPVFCEIYRRLRKLPEFEGPVAVLFPQSIYSICSRYKLSMEEYTEQFDYLVKKELISVVDKGEGYSVLTIDKSIFLTNSMYYKESGTDSDFCAEYFISDYEKVGEEDED